MGPRLESDRMPACGPRPKHRIPDTVRLVIQVSEVAPIRTALRGFLMTLPEADPTPSNHRCDQFQPERRIHKGVFQAKTHFVPQRMILRERFSLIAWENGT